MDKSEDPAGSRNTQSSDDKTLNLDDFRATDNLDQNYQPIDFRYVNGTEGNQILDTEDLDGDAQLDTVDSYFGIEVDLADSSLWAVDVRRDFVVNDPGAPLTEVPADSSGWRLVRVPLADASRVREFTSEGATPPSWNRVFHARLWITGLESQKVLQLSGMRLLSDSD